MNINIKKLEGKVANILICILLLSLFVTLGIGITKDRNEVKKNRAIKAAMLEDGISTSTVINNDNIETELADNEEINTDAKVNEDEATEAINKNSTSVSKNIKTKAPGTTSTSSESNTVSNNTTSSVSSNAATSSNTTASATSNVNENVTPAPTPEPTPTPTPTPEPVDGSSTDTNQSTSAWETINNRISDTQLKN
jgi:hypothetical protein